MSKYTEDSRSKNRQQIVKHLEVAVLQEKWLKENAGKKKADWTQKVLRSMQKKYTVTWIGEKTISLQLEKREEKRMTTSAFEAKSIQSTTPHFLRNFFFEEIFSPPRPPVKN